MNNLPLVPGDGGNTFLEQLRGFLNFLKSLWGLLTGITTLFPLSNNLAQVIPLADVEHGGAFWGVPPRLITAMTTVIALFVLVGYYSERREYVSRKKRGSVQSDALVAAVVAILLLFAYLLAYNIVRTVWTATSPGLGFAIFRTSAEIVMLCLYAGFFAAMTAAFMEFALLEYFERPGERRRRARERRSE